MREQSLQGAKQEECHTVNCYNVPTTTLRIESDYESVAGETKTTVLKMSYCDEHAKMWLDLSGVDGHRYEVIDG